jgi:hypothetical protein
MFEPKGKVVIPGVSHLLTLPPKEDNIEIRLVLPKAMSWLQK